MALADDITGRHFRILELVRNTPTAQSVADEPQNEEQEDLDHDDDDDETLVDGQHQAGVTDDTEFWRVFGPVFNVRWEEALLDGQHRSVVADGMHEAQNEEEEDSDGVIDYA